MKWVDYSNEKAGLEIERGECTVKSLLNHMHFLNAKAVELQKKENFDHVIYGGIIYKDGEPEQANFYMLGVTEEDFEERTKNFSAQYPDSRIFAVHKL
jgi:hypothetical protein